MRYYVSRDEARERRDYFHKMYPHMLIEDVSVGIMPIGGRTERREFEAHLVPRVQAAEVLVAEALGRGHERDLGAAVCDFVRECAQVVMAYGCGLYEIVYLSEAAGSSPSDFRLELIQPGTVVRRGSGFVQHVPAVVAHERGLAEYLTLPADRLLNFEPKVYREQKVKEALESLAVLSEQPIPDFALQQKANVPFEFAAYERSQKEALAAATRAIGWNARGLLQKEPLEHYWMQRHLTFEEFKIQLRDEILATLREGLERIGRVMGLSGELEVSGLPTIADVARARAALMEGEGTFKEIAALVAI